MVELAVVFVIAVIMLRGFLMEGFLISTGSMAPGLRGLHKQVRCPSCGFAFAFGVAFDDSLSDDEQEDVSSDYATCPNCGQTHINTSDIPKAHGDQLLVHKGVFQLRNPDRWERVVFRNPANPQEAYVKRVIARGGESLQVISGDIFIDETIARKDFEVARDMRILVFDSWHPAKDDGWERPCRAGDNWSWNSAGGLSREATASASVDDRDWIHLRYWRRSGGQHVTEVPAPFSSVDRDWDQCLTYLNQSRFAWLTVLDFDRSRRLLQVIGVMPYEMQSELGRLDVSEKFKAALARLGALSHFAPITDRYGYNTRVYSPEYPVTDLALSAEFRWETPPDSVAARMPVANDVVRVQVQPQTGEVTVIRESDDVQVVRASVSALASGMTLDVSNFDCRLLVAINGHQVFAPYDVPFTRKAALEKAAAFTPQLDLHERAKQTVTEQRRQSELAVSASGTVEIARLRIYRDVYYTPGRRVNGVDLPIRVRPNQYFVLGDNSPVSSDSRSWPKPFVDRDLLIGKPFVVHLPSRPGAVESGERRLPIRIPDWDRIRYIR